MNSFRLNRRDMMLGTGASLLALGTGSFGQAAQTPHPEPATPPRVGRDPIPAPPTPDQVRRLQWWRKAKYGMFIHYGLYSLRARQEWAMEKEAIPIPEYQKLATEFHPKRVR